MLSGCTVTAGKLYRFGLDIGKGGSIVWQGRKKRCDESFAPKAICASVP